MVVAVYIVDDDAALRQALADQVKSMGLPVSCYSSAAELLMAFDGRRPAVIVTDLRMPEMSGVELQAELQRRGAPVSLILFTGHADVTTAVTVMKAGGLDVIEKSRSPAELMDAIQRAVADAGSRQVVVDERNRVTELISSLTPRERDVLKLIVKGLPNKLIADELGISINTVEVHRGRVMRKMRADSVAELVRLTIGSLAAA